MSGPRVKPPVFPQAQKVTLKNLSNKASEWSSQVHGNSSVDKAGESLICRKRFQVVDS